MDLSDKLQTKEQPMRIVNPPPSFSPGFVSNEAAHGGILVFVKDQAELRRHEKSLVAAAKADRLTWIAYPKAGQLGTDLNRDILWKLLAAKRVQPVRSISIDDVWSALRFRPAKE